MLYAPKIINKKSTAQNDTIFDVFCYDPLSHISEILATPLAVTSSELTKRCKSYVKSINMVYSEVKLNAYTM